MAQFCLAQPGAGKILALHTIHRNDTMHFRQSHGPHDPRWDIVWDEVNNINHCFVYGDLAFLRVFGTQVSRTPSVALKDRRLYAI